MDLFKKVEALRDVKEYIKKQEEEIREDILAKLVNLRYQIQEVEAGYIDREESETVKVNYPILDLPEGFLKSEDEFFRMYANQIVHMYTLKNSEGREIQIEEIANFKWGIYENLEVAIKVRPYMVLKNILYKINISEVSYKFYREFSYREMLEQVVEDKDMIFTCEKVLYTDQESYEKYIRALGKEEDIIPLKDLVESLQKEIQITPILTAEVCIEQRVGIETVWYESEKVSVRLNLPYTLNTITINPKTIDGVSLGSVKFEYSQFDEEFKTKMTLSEVLQLIKE